MNTEDEYLPLRPFANHQAPKHGTCRICMAKYGSDYYSCHGERDESMVGPLVTVVMILFVVILAIALAG